MVSKNTKVFVIDGNKYRFNFLSFNTVFDLHCEKQSIHKYELEETIADELHISKDAVHNWRYQSNGPSDIEIVRTLGDILNVDYMLLLKIIEESEKPVKYSDLQIQAIKRVYDAIIDFLDEFLHTDGFNNLWLDFVDNGTPKDLIESMIYEKADRMIRDVDKVLLKEYFYLHDCEIFDSLQSFINNELMDTYDGKCSYAYRFECIVEDVNGHRENSTSEDYIIALNKINSVVENVI